MALSGDVLGKAIADKIVDSNADTDAKAAVLAIWKKIAGEIVDHFVKNTVVTVTVATGIAVSTSGTAAAQTGSTTSTGSGTGTIK
jgi:hypothetical protein